MEDESFTEAAEPQGQWGEREGGGDDIKQVNVSRYAYVHRCPLQHVV